MNDIHNVALELHTYIPIYIHTYIYTYPHTYIHTIAHVALAHIRLNSHMDYIHDSAYTIYMTDIYDIAIELHTYYHRA